MLERLQLLKTDLSEVKMSVSLEGGVKDLPEVTVLLSAIDREDKTRLLTALHDAFTKRDLTKVSALYSYIVLFPEADQAEIKQEILHDFQGYIKGYRSEEELNDIFTHPGFAMLVNGLNNKVLTDMQFQFFSLFHLDNKTNIGKKIAGIQKTLPLSAEQRSEVIQYLEEIKAEKQKSAEIENKNSNKVLIWTLIGAALLIIRILLRLSRD
jgi:hypothetical protein